MKNSNQDLRNAYDSIYLAESKEIEGVKETEKSPYTADGQRRFTKVDEDKEINLKITATTSDKEEDAKESTEDKKCDGGSCDAIKPVDVTEEGTSAFDILMNKLNINKLAEGSCGSKKKMMKKRGMRYESVYNEEDEMGGMAPPQPEEEPMGAPEGGGGGINFADYSIEEKVEALVDLVNSVADELLGGGMQQDDDYQDSELEDVPDEDMDFEESTDFDDEVVEEMYDKPAHPAKTLGHAILNLKKGLQLRQGMKANASTRYAGKNNEGKAKTTKLNYSEHDGQQRPVKNFTRGYKVNAHSKSTPNDPIF